MMRMLFCRIGWMLRYAGPHPDDPKPIGGGEYNKRKIGHEAYNFLRLPGERLEGFVQAGGNYLRLDRIEPSVNLNAKSLPNVLVVFFARDPRRGGQFVVGWYKNAAVLAEPEWSGAPQRKRFGFNIKAKAADSVLLAPDARDLSVPHGQGNPGISNVYYLFDDDGRKRKKQWIDLIMKAVDRGSDRNLLAGAMPNLESAAGTDFENDASAARGQGILINPAARRVIEMRAMRVALSHFKKRYTVEDVSRTRAYDLLCTSKRETVRVEVKGTQGKGEVVFLTAGEVKAARTAGKHALAIVSDIKLSQRSKNSWRAAGGRLKLFVPWKPTRGLTPLAYSYKTKGL